MQTVTLSNLRARVRKKIDAESASTPTASQVDGEINNSIRRLHAKIATLSDDEATVGLFLATTPDQSWVELPNDFLVLRGIEWFPGATPEAPVRETEGGALRITEDGAVRDLETGLVTLTGDLRFEKLERWQFQSRARWDSTSGWGRGGSPIAYRVVGKDSSHVRRIELLPKPLGTHAIRIWYVPTATELTSDTSTYDGLSGYDQWVVLDSAVSLGSDEEDDVSTWILERERIWAEQIAPLFAVADQATPDTVVDVEAGYIGEEFGAPYRT